MITLNGHNPDLLGLSTDTKPLTGYGVNTLFLELDTADFYYFDGTDWAKVGGTESTRTLSLNLNKSETKSLAEPEETEEETKEEEPEEEPQEEPEVVKDGKTK